MTASQILEREKKFAYYVGTGCKVYETCRGRQAGLVETVENKMGSIECCISEASPPAWHNVEAKKQASYWRADFAMWSRYSALTMAPSSDCCQVLALMNTERKIWVANPQFCFEGSMILFICYFLPPSEQWAWDKESSYQVQFMAQMIICDIIVGLLACKQWIPYKFWNSKSSDGSLLVPSKTHFLSTCSTVSFQFQSSLQILIYSVPIAWDWPEWPWCKMPVGKRVLGLRVDFKIPKSATLSKPLQLAYKA